MRQPFAQDAVVIMEAGGDPRAPGAAITVALCGHWDHDPPCPLAPHHTAVDRVNDAVHVRTLFAVDAAWEAEVRRRIRAALSAGRLVGADGEESRWRLHSSGPSVVRPEEVDHARRLAAD